MGVIGIRERDLSCVCSWISFFSSAGVRWSSLSYLFVVSSDHGRDRGTSHFILQLPDEVTNGKIEFDIPLSVLLRLTILSPLALKGIIGGMKGVIQSNNASNHPPPTHQYPPPVPKS